MSCLAYRTSIVSFHMTGHFFFFNCLAVVKLNPAFKKPLFLEKTASALSFNWSEAKVLVKVSLKRIDWRTSGQNVGKTNEKHA